MRYTPLFFLAPMVLVQAQANEYFSTETAQKALFPAATSFTAKPLALDDAARDEIERLSDVRQRWKEQPVWEAFDQQKFLGWYIEDRVIGKHEFIRYALAISPAGKVIGIEIMEYLETYGDQVREASWRGQFIGRDEHSGFKLGRDIQNISGATLSCRNLTNGVKRLLVLQQLYLKPPG
ncbi:FMN-binding protein [Halothiobacillus sp. DCM-1]|uniref:FMN-binding protein n=1 Tax=Halothiobacillus sp. DCM-1 TaxID=3112558 RepID=UPI00324D66FD